ncbi:MAG: hypothetical protein IJH07_10360 [Ruminococcus sp.]|nr:hypothetical protein [Ruminococcus sp.]
MPNYNNRRDDRREMNAIQRDRIERRRELRRKSMITNAFVIGVIAVAVIGIIIAVVAMSGKNKPETKAAEPTAVTATIASGTQNTKETTAKTNPTQAYVSSQYDYSASSQDDNPYSYDDSTSSSQNSSQTSSSSASSAAEPGSIDDSGNSIHYTATGQTSYGYDWTYEGGGGIVDVSCNYNFDTNQYDFVITGLSEGTTSLTLYYNTDDGVQQPVTLNLSVDGNLNVSQI